jgi:hypothetical protein
MTTRRFSTLFTMLLIAMISACGDDAQRERPSAENRIDEDASSGGDVSAPGVNTGTTGPDSGSNGDSHTTPPPAPAQTLSARYPGDEGIASDPAVIWHENFEQATIADLGARYDQARTAGMTFIAQTPPASGGRQAISMAAGGSIGEATDLYTRLPGDGYEQLYVRYYVRHRAGASYHHTGMWIGGYNPPTAWPNPRAGQRPQGNDRLSVAVEPMSEGPRRTLDSYLYWMHMRSWEANNPMGSSAYGNTVVHRNDFATDDGQWHCLEIMVRLNDDPNSAAGGELAFWLDDALMYHYTDTAPRGYWIRDKFCPADADRASCTDYAPAPDERSREVLNLQWRNSSDLRLNYLWLQNYVSNGTGTVDFDDVVVATTRIGCTVP